MEKFVNELNLNRVLSKINDEITQRQGYSGVPGTQVYLHTAFADYVSWGSVVQNLAPIPQSTSAVRIMRPQSQLTTRQVLSDTSGGYATMFSRATPFASSQSTFADTDASNRMPHDPDTTRVYSVAVKTVQDLGQMRLVANFGGVSQTGGVFNTTVGEWTRLFIVVPAGTIGTNLEVLISVRAVSGFSTDAGDLFELDEYMITNTESMTEFFVGTKLLDVNVTGFSDIVTDSSRFVGLKVSRSPIAPTDPSDFQWINIGSGGDIDLSGAVLLESTDAQIINSDLALDVDSHLFGVDSQGRQKPLISHADYGGGVEQTEVGNTTHHLNLNSVDRPTVELDGLKEDIAYLSDLIDGGNPLPDNILVGEVITPTITHRVVDGYRTVPPWDNRDGAPENAGGIPAPNQFELWGGSITEEPYRLAFSATAHNSWWQIFSIGRIINPHEAIEVVEMYDSSREWTLRATKDSFVQISNTMFQLEFTDVAEAMQGSLVVKFEVRRASEFGGEVINLDVVANTLDVEFPFHSGIGLGIYIPDEYQVYSYDFDQFAIPLPENMFNYDSRGLVITVEVKDRFYTPTHGVEWIDATVTMAFRPVDGIQNVTITSIDVTDSGDESRSTWSDEMQVMTRIDGDNLIIDAGFASDNCCCQGGGFNLHSFAYWQLSCDAEYTDISIDGELLVKRTLAGLIGGQSAKLIGDNEFVGNNNVTGSLSVNGEDVALKSDGFLLRLSLTGLNMQLSSTPVSVLQGRTLSAIATLLANTELGEWSIGSNGQLIFPAINGYTDYTIDVRPTGSGAVAGNNSAEIVADLFRQNAQNVAVSRSAIITNATPNLAMKSICFESYTLNTNDPFIDGGVQIRLSCGVSATITQLDIVIKGSKH